MGEFFKDKPKNKEEELQRDLWIINNRLCHLENVARLNDNGNLLAEILDRIITLEHNLARHEHKDGKAVIVEELR